VAIFDRILRRSAADDATENEPAPIAPHLLPDVNQRVTVAMGEHVPVPSRVEDVVAGTIQLAFPSLPLEFGDLVVMTWERDGAWFSMETRVLGVDERAAVPTVQVSAAGRLSRYDERRVDTRREIQLPIELRVVRARAIRPGRELQTMTVEVSATALRFATSAPFAPGDLIEARLRLGEGADEIVSSRVRVIRVDAVTGSWRSTCTVTFDEILRSDRARLAALAASAGTGRSDVTETSSSAPTADGIGGRDEPADLGNPENVVEWLRRRG
jgi:hypothetical protein